MNDTMNQAAHQASGATVRPAAGDALILVDPQNDFCPGGSLAVADGDQVMGPLNHLVEVFAAQDLPVYATRDWHPADHVSFAARGGPWPPHCVQGTAGAAYHPDLRLSRGAEVISKASDPDADAYSGFEGTDLHLRLQRQGVRRVVVGGLATDYCVLNTVRDALRLGYDVVVAEDAIRAVDVQPHDGEAAIAEMTDGGARFVTSGQVQAAA